MNYLRFVSLLMLLNWFYSCADSDFTLEPTLEDEEIVTDETAIAAGNLEAKYQTLLAKVNELRASGCRCGTEDMPAVGSVRWNDKLGVAALRHSNDMNKNNHFSHTGTDGSNAGQRITASGYSWRTYGENIAFGYPTAEAVFAGWKNSEGHCRNIMNAAFVEMGAADVEGYWTQEFGAQRN